MKRKIIASVMAVASILSLSACKEIDNQAVNAELIYGTSDLFWFCDVNDTLIYFEDYNGDDEYVGMWWNGCINGKPRKLAADPNSNGGGVTGNE